MMPLFAKNPNEAAYAGGQKHIVDVIKNRTGNDTLIFKNPEEDFNEGSTLIVEPGEQAIYVYQGTIERVFKPGTYTLSSANYAFISRFRNSLSGGISSFHGVVYFVRTATSREIRWGTPTPIKAYDKALLDPTTGLGVQTDVRVRGSYRVKVSDAGKFLSELIGNNYDLATQESLTDFFREQFTGEIISYLNQEINNWSQPLITVTSQASSFASKLRGVLAPVLAEYGLSILNFAISGIDIVDSDDRHRVMELAQKNRETYFESKTAGAAAAAEAEGKQRAYQIYGTNYQQVRALNALQDAASNQGSGSGQVMGAGLGLAMGAGLGQMVPGLLGQAFQTGQQPASAAQQSAAQPGTVPQAPNQTPTQTPNQAPAAQQQGESAQTAGQPAQQANSSNGNDPVARLTKLKKLADAGLISNDEYNAKKQEIIESI